MFQSILLVNGGLMAGFGPLTALNLPLTMRSAKSAGCAACVCARGYNRKQPATIQDQGMPISEIPLFSMLRTRMQWHQERQRLLAENVANADTPKFQPRDLAPPKFDRHAAGRDARPGAHQRRPSRRADGRRTRRSSSTAAAASRCGPAGNAVNLEDEMLKVAVNQMDYQAATALYTRRLGLLKTAIGKRS